MSLLRNSFTFGFELEAFGRTSKFSDDFDYDRYDSDYESYDEMPCNYINDYDDDMSSYYGGINRYIKYNYNMQGCTHYDGSVKNYKDGYTSFEWSSPVFDFTTSNLLKVKRFLSNLDKEDIHINNTCGFHTHFSYKGICEKDVIWILTYIAMNEDAFKTFTEFEYDRKVEGELFPEHVKVDFFNERYADKQYLENIKDRLLNKDYDSLSTIFNDYKYRVLRIHPQGTMEWRGPREFLYTKNGVKTYIDTLYKVVDIFIKALKTKTINGLTRDEYIDNLKIHCIENCDSNVLPDITLKQKRNGSCGIMPWFWDKTHPITSGKRYHNYVGDTVIGYFINKIVKNPTEINDVKYSDYLRSIVHRLNEQNNLRKVIEYNINNDIKLTKNVQFVMLFENITLLPYVEESTWKYIPKSVFSGIINNCKFHDESTYKYQTLDYILNKLPKDFSSLDTLNFLRLLPSLDWISLYIMKTHKERLFSLFDSVYNTKKSSGYNTNTYTEDRLKEVKDMLIKTPNGSTFARVLNYLCVGDESNLFVQKQWVTISPNSGVTIGPYDEPAEYRSIPNIINTYSDITSVNSAIDVVGISN